MLPKLWEFIKAKQSEIVLAVSVVLIALIAFESGRISALHRFDDPLEIKYPSTEVEQTTSNQTQKDKASKTDTGTISTKTLDLRVMASKNSTLYHFLWCSGAQRIKEGNKIIFSSERDAQSKGYKLASNCQK